MIRITVGKSKKDTKYSGNVLIFKDPDTFLLLQRAPTDYWMPNRWGLVGGHVQEGEALRMGTCREVKEESNLDIKPQDLIYLYEVKDRISFFTTNKFSGEIKTNPAEHQDHKWFTEEDLKDLELTPDIEDLVKKSKQKLYNVTT